MTDPRSALAITKPARPKTRRVAALLALCLGASPATLAAAANLSTPAGGNAANLPTPAGGNAGDLTTAQQVAYTPVTVNKDGKLTVPSTSTTSFTSAYNTANRTATIYATASADPAGIIHWKDYNVATGYTLNYRVNQNNPNYTIINWLDDGGNYTISGLVKTYTIYNSTPTTTSTAGNIWFVTSNGGGFFLNSGGVVRSNSILVTNASNLTKNNHPFTNAGLVEALNGISGFDITQVSSSQLPDIANALGSALWATGNVSVATNQVLSLNSSGEVMIGGVTTTGELAVQSASAITLQGNVSTTGAQSYTGPVTLAADTTLDTTKNGVGNGANISFNALTDSDGNVFPTTIDSQLNSDSMSTYHSLTLTAGTAGAVYFSGAVGGAAALSQLSVTAAGGITLTGNVTTTDTQTYTGPVTLAADTTLDTTGAGSGTGANISFTDATTTIDGGYGLTLTAGTGTVAFNGLVGSSSPLSALSVTAGGITLPGSVVTTGDQSYTGPVILAADTTLDTTGAGSATGANISFTDATTTIDSQLNSDSMSTYHSLTLTAGTGAVYFSGAVGGAAALSALSVTAGGITLPGSVVTAGDQTYTGNVTLAGVTVLDTTSNSSNGAISLGAVTGGGNDLTLNSGSGAQTLNGVTGVGALSLDTTGVKTLNAGEYGWSSVTTKDGGDNLGAVTTTGVLTFDQATTFGAVTLAADTSLDTSQTNANISFTTTIDSKSNSDGSGPFGLIVTAGTGTASFGGAVGSSSPLSQLSVTASGITLPVSVVTTGDQSYTGAVSLAGTTVLNTTSNSSNGAITLGAVSGNGNDLTLNSGSGAQTLNGVTGVGALTLDTRGVKTLNGGGENGKEYGWSSVTTKDGGDNLGAVTTTGVLTFDQATTFGAVTLAADTTLNGSDITFSSTIDGGYGLTLAATGAASFNGAVGSFSPLTQLSVTAGGITLKGKVTTTDTQTYTGPVILAADTTLDTTGAGGTGAKISFNAPTDSTAPPTTIDGAFGLTLKAGTTGAVAFSGWVGFQTSLSFLSVNATGGITLPASVTTTGDQTYTGPVALTADTVLNGSDVGFASAIDGGFGLTLNATGAASFGGAVGGTTALTQLSVTAAGGITLTGNVTTTDTQTYTGAVTLAADTTLDTTGGATTKGANISFTGTIDSATQTNSDGHAIYHSLTLTTGPGTAFFGGAVGEKTALTALTVTAGGITLPASVTTKGAQSYTGPVTLAADTTLSAASGDPTSGASIAFQDAATTIDGAYGLTVQSDGTAAFKGAVGSSHALSQFVVRGRAISVLAVHTAEPAQTGLAPQSAGSTGGLIDLFASSGGLSLSGDLDTGAGLVVLRAGGSISQTGGVITAGVLTGGSNYGSVHLSSANQVAELAAFSAGGEFEFHNARALLVSGAVIDGTGVTSAGISAGTLVQGSATLTTTSGDLTLASRSGATSPTAVITASDGVQLSAAGNLLLGGQAAGDGAVTATGETVGLEASGNITQASNAGVITAKALTGSATGSVTLASANTIAQIGPFKTGGDFILTDTVAPTGTDSLTIGGTKTITAPAGVTPSPGPQPSPTPTPTPAPLPGSKTPIADCGAGATACVTGVDEVLTFRSDRVVNFPALAALLSEQRSDPAPVWQGDEGGRR